MHTAAAIAQIKTVTAGDVERYVRYLGRITPRSREDLFRRWLFAFASVHTTWKLNCKLYHALSDLSWRGDEAKLKQLIMGTGAGLHNNRTKFIQRFSDYFWAHPDWFWKADSETWIQYRDRIQDAADGIGRAKSSFVVEMAYPADAGVICTDTHIMQLYGRKPSAIGKGRVSDKEEAAMEAHWVRACNARSLPPAVTRWVFWDRKQGYADPRYWSFVFERNNFHDIFAQSVIQGGGDRQGAGDPGSGAPADGVGAETILQL